MGKGGESSSERDGDEAPGILEDPRFQPFRGESFDVASFTSNVLAGSHTTAQAQSEQLRDGVKLLEAELASQVTGRKAELLTNVKRMLDAENSLGNVILSVESLQSAVRRIRAEIAGPYEHIKGKTRQLRNLHSTVDLLRHLIHRIKLAQKLRAQMAAPAGQLDLAKAAKLITDIRAVDKEVDLSGIDVVDADEDFLKQASATVHEQAEAALAEGMESMSQAKVGSALQVFFNLEELHLAVDGLLSRYLHDLERTAKAALDARSLTAAAAAQGSGASGAGGVAGAAVVLPLVGGSAGASRLGPGQGATGSWQDKLWHGLRELADAIAGAATAVWHLQRVVAKKKDPLTHVCFLDVLVQPGQPLLCQKFWDDVVRVVGEAVAAVGRPSTKGGIVRDALVAGYPRLAHTLESMFERLASETTMKGVLPAVGPAQLSALLGATGPLQASYLAGCLSRMSDAVGAAFPGGARALPSPADVQKCIGTLHEELKAGGGSPQLAALVASTAGKALALLCERAEYMAATGPEVRQVAINTPAAPAQARNIALCSQLQEVHRSLSSLLPRLPPTAAPALASALDAVQTTAVETVAPVFKSVMEALEDRIAKVHSAHLGAEEPVPPAAAGAGAAPGGGSGGGGRGSSDGGGMVNTSLHVVEAVALINTFKSEFLSRFVPVPSPNLPSVASSLVERMAGRLLAFFVRHAALVRPLSAQGRLQLAKDMAELQLAVGGGLFPLEQLGAPYRALKALRSLLFAEPNTVLGAPLLRELPPAITAHHLFSRLPAHVQAPHERSGLSPSQYSLWMDSHTQGEVMRGVRSAVEAAEGELRAAGPAAQEVASVILALCAQTEAAEAAAAHQQQQHH